MAIQHTKADGTQTTGGDVPVVAPMNIGKGLLWDPSTKTYYVAIDDRTFEVDELGRLKLRVSALESNQLSIRDDGLYQGAEAKPELKNLYVDAVNGIDQDPLKVKGAGTRATPLRTFKYANEVAEVNTTRTIHLHEDQEHIVSASDPFRVKSGSLTVLSYGPLVDAAKLTTSIPYSKVSSDGKGPKLVFTGITYEDARQANATANRMSIFSVTDCSLNFNGVDFINDVNVTLRDGAHPMTFATPNRITLERSSVYFTYGRISSRGTLQSTAASAYSTTTTDGIYKAGLFYPRDSIVTIYTLNNKDTFATDMKGAIIGDKGWAYEHNKGATYNAGPASYVNLEELAKRFVGKRFDTLATGVKIISVPSTNIETRYWG